MLASRHGKRRRGHLPPALDQASAAVILADLEAAAAAAANGRFLDANAFQATVAAADDLVGFLGEARLLPDSILAEYCERYNAVKLVGRRVRAKLRRQGVGQSDQIVSLPDDIVRHIFAALANPLDPAPAVHLASTCKYLWVALRTGSGCELQRLQSFTRSTDLLCDVVSVAGAQPATRAQLQLATTLTTTRSATGRTFKVGDCSTLAALMEGGWLDRLQALRLEVPYLGVAGFRPIFEALAGGALPKLRHLNLSHNILDEGGGCICSALSRIRLPAGCGLSLSNNRITSDGVVALAGALARGAFPSLVALDLSDNDIDGAGVEAIAECGRMGHLRSLQSLNLDGNDGTTAASIDVLAAALRAWGTFPALKSIYLPHEAADFGPAGARLVAVCNRERNVGLSWI